MGVRLRPVKRINLRIFVTPGPSDNTHARRRLYPDENGSESGRIVSFGAALQLRIQYVHEKSPRGRDGLLLKIARVGWGLESYLVGRGW